MVDVSVFQPEPDSDEGEASQNRPSNKPADLLDKEADEVLARILDEVKHAPGEGTFTPGHDEDVEEETQMITGSNSTNLTALNLPETPSKLPEPAERDEHSNEDGDLASRFAGLSLPSVPTTITRSKPSTKPASGFTDEEIDAWCVICCDDATLQCIGCDGDLYCTNCWMEGHRGEDAGLDERRHKAIQYVKGGGKKKQPKRRVMVGV